MPILWFEQHVKMSQEIADEVKMITSLPHQGQMMGIVFILIGIIQITFLPIKNLITRSFCSKNSKICNMDKTVHIELENTPEFSPLIVEKPSNGISLIGKSRNIALRS